MLGARLGYASYLEICTPTTGATFAKVDQAQFPERTRVIYRCPEGFSDGAPIADSTEKESSEEVLVNLLRRGQRFDLVFIDPFHTYLSSLRDIVFGLQLVKSNGVLLIHDLNPPNPECVSPQIRAGEWCGETFAAFLDIALFDDDLRYATIDTDYGCGIISTHPLLESLLKPHPGRNLTSSWRSLQPNERYHFLDQHRSELLRLTSTDDFRQYLNAGSANGIDARNRTHRLARLGHYLADLIPECLRFKTPKQLRQIPTRRAEQH